MVASTAIMRLALLADIHGNLAALEAVIEELSRQKVDRVFVLGDVVVGGPDSLACWERVKSLGWPCLRGNHERYVFDLHSPRAKPEWRTERFGPVHYAAAKLGEARASELAALPPHLRVPEFPDVIFVHASERNDSDLVFPYTTDAELEAMTAETPERLILRGHNHFAAVRPWRGKRIVTVGSVGLPLDGIPSAQFTIIQRRGHEWDVQHQCLKYDITAAVARFKESGYLDEAGPMARLYQREVLTASFQILPFLAWYGGLTNTGIAPPLERAVAQFLGDW